MKNRLMQADDVANELGISKPYAYKLIRQLNDELNSMGFLTIPGKVARKYFTERFYGMEKEMD